MASMISHDHRCIFIHLRRTGGNSVESALGAITLLDRHGNPTTIWDDALHRGKTPFKQDFRGHYIHDTALAVSRRFPKEFADYFKFSFVRNPWEQLLSSFHRRKATTDVSPSSFRKFIMSYETLEGTVPRRSLYDESGRCLMDYIGRFEQIERDFAEVCRRIGATNIRLPHHNGTRSVRDYRSYYDDDSAQRVADLFGEDIEEFGYAF